MKLWKIRFLFGFILALFTVLSYPILQSYAEMIDVPVEVLLAVVAIPSIIVLSSMLE